jgi:hypothetical protein
VNKILVLARDSDTTRHALACRLRISLRFCTISIQPRQLILAQLSSKSTEKCCCQTPCCTLGGCSLAPVIYCKGSQISGDIVIGQNHNVYLRQALIYDDTTCLIIQIVLKSVSLYVLRVPTCKMRGRFSDIRSDIRATKQRVY